MAGNNSENDNKKQDSGKSSTKRLVRILIIVGIGIPVLVELLTLFNLINVQLIGGEEEPASQTRSAIEEVSTYVEGDTLLSDSPNPLVIREMKIKVSAQLWRLELNISPTDTIAANKNLVFVDSLKLKSGAALRPEDAITLYQVGETGPSFIAEWELSDGDIPQIMYVRSAQPVASDSIMIVRQEVKLGKLPIRYEQ